MVDQVGVIMVAGVALEVVGGEGEAEEELLLTGPPVVGWWMIGG